MFPSSLGIFSGMKMSKAFFKINKPFNCTKQQLFHCQNIPQSKKRISKSEQI